VLACFLKRRYENRDQDGNNSHHDKKLNQRETM